MANTDLLKLSPATGTSEMYKESWVAVQALKQHKRLQSKLQIIAKAYFAMSLVESLNK